MWQPGPSIRLQKNTVYSYTHRGNGLSVLLCPVVGSRVCAYMRAVSAGSKDEHGKTGSAHFIEHMSFRIQKGKIWSLASKGDVINAETNMDSTRFYVVHLPHQTEDTIRIDSERFKQASVPVDKVSVELQAVINEMLNGERAGNQMFHTTSALAILEHPYHHSTIGTRFDVSSTTAADMENFRKQFYVPNNTTLIFSGHFDAEQILQDVHENFGSIPASKTLETEHTPEPPQYGRRFAELNIEAPCPMICMAFRCPEGSTKESVVLQCISRLTWHNSQGRAKQLIDTNVLHDVSTYAPRQLNPYLWFMHGTLETSGNLEMAETKMHRVLESFATHPVIEEELQACKSSLRDDWNRSLESVTDIMNELGRGVSMGDWKDCASRVVALESVTPADITSVAKLVFRRHHMTVTHVKPTAKKLPMSKATALPPIVTEKSPLSFPEVVASKAGWSLESLSPGTNVLHVPRASYVRVTLSARFSPAQQDMASLFVSHMKNKPQMTTALHTERHFSHDHEFVHMTMEMPTNTNVLEQSSNIMFNQEWLNPSIHNVSVQKRHMVAEMNAMKKDQTYLTKSHFIKSLFEKTTYHTPLEVRINRIDQLTKQDIHRFHASWIDQARSMVTIVTPTVEAAAILGKILPANASVPETTFEWQSSVRKAYTKHVGLHGYGSFQIMLGQTVPLKQYTRSAIALECAAGILGGGMTGRLMHTVREQKGLGTYGIYAVMQYVSPKTDGIFCIQGTFSPSSIEEGLTCTRELLHDWHENGVTAAEFENARERMLGSRIIANDSVDRLHGTVLQYMLHHKSPKQAMEEYESTLNDITLAEVNDTLARFIDPQKMSEVVVGPT